MAEKRLKIIVEIDGESKEFLGTLKGVENATKKQSGILTGIFQGIGQQITRVFVDTAKWAFRQFVEGVKWVGQELIETVKLAAEVSEAFSEVATLGVSDMDSLREGVLRLSADMGIDLIDAINATYQAISAGVPEANVLDFIDVSSELAVAGLAELEQTVDGLTSVINAYGMSFDEARRISDIMFTTVRLGKTRVEELAFYIGRVTPLAAQMGIEFEEVSAILASATRSGIRTRLAVTGLRSALANILTPSEQAIQVFKDMGLTVDDVGRMVSEAGLIEFLRQLTPDQLKQVISSVEGLNTVLAVVGRDGGAQFETFLADIQDSTGATAKALENVIGTTARQWKIMRSTIDVIRVEAIQPVEAYAGEVLKILNENLLTPLLENVVPLIAEYLDMMFSGDRALAVLDTISLWSNMAVERLITDIDLALMGEMTFGEMIEGWLRDGWIVIRPVVREIAKEMIKIFLEASLAALEEGFLFLTTEIERILNQYPFLKQIITGGTLTGLLGAYAGGGGLLSFHNGGIVPDLLGGGREYPVMVQPGEEIIRNGDTVNNRYNLNITITGGGDAKETARAIKNMLRREELSGRGYRELAPEIA